MIGILELELDLHQIQLYGFSHEGPKTDERIQFFEGMIRDGAHFTEVWVGKINDTIYQLLNSTDIPHLPSKNLAGHHRAIAYARQDVPMKARVMLYLPQLSYHADTLIADIRVH